MAELVEIAEQLKTARAEFEENGELILLLSVLHDIKTSLRKIERQLWVMEHNQRGVGTI